MAGREVREYTNLTDPKDKKSGKGKDRIDDEEITFQRMVAKMQEVAGERGGYLHGRGALDSDDLLYLKEQMEAEEDAERLLRRTEKRAFAAFKKAVAETAPASVPLPLRVEPKPKSGIRQQDLLKRVVEVKPKRQRVSSSSDVDPSSTTLSGQPSKKHLSLSDHEKEKEWSQVHDETASASVPLPLRVEPKPKSGIRQQDLLKRVVEVKPKRQSFSSSSDVDPSSTTLSGQPSKKHQSASDHAKEKGQCSDRFSKVGEETKFDNPVKSLLAAYESSDDED